MTWDAAYGLYEAVVNANLPVVLDHSMINDTTSISGDTQHIVNGNNMVRLAYLLRYHAAVSSDKSDVFVTDSSENAWTTVIISKLVGYDIQDEDVFANTGSVSYGDYGYVDGSIFIRNDNTIGNIASPSSENKDVSALQNTIFKWDWSANPQTVVSGYKADVEDYAVGTTNVLEEIKNDNFYQQSGDDTDDSNISEYSTGTINQATFLKYILNYQYRRITIHKDTITVLDLEPSKYSTLSEEQIRNWLSTEDQTYVENINIVQMSTSEFIGKLTDLQEDYDLVYIGGATASGDKLVSMNPTKSGITLLYSHIGREENDLEAKYGGLLDSEYIEKTTTIGGTSTTSYTYTKVTSLDQITDGKYIIVGAYPGVSLNRAISNTMGLAISLDVTDYLSSNTAIDGIDNYLWTISKNGDGYSIQANNQNLYLNMTSESSAEGVSLLSNKQVLNISTNPNYSNTDGAVSVSYTGTTSASYDRAITINRNDYGYHSLDGKEYYYKYNDVFYRVTGIGNVYGGMRVYFNGTSQTLYNTKKVTVYEKTREASDWIGYFNNRNGRLGSYSTNDINSGFYLYKVTTTEVPATDATIVTSRGLKNENVITAYSGNDISKENMEALISYVNAKYPVVVSSEFLSKSTSGNKLNTAKLDTTSYMYQFLDQVKTIDNVFSDSAVASSTSFVKYLNMPKVYLTMIDWPTDYNGTDTLLDLERDPFSFVFEFSSSSESTSGDKYTVQLFEDINADGKYSNTEELDRLVVRNLNSNEIVSVDELEAGVRYEVTRVFPDDTVGLIPWKLTITMNDSEGEVHTSMTGYCAYKVPSNKTAEINVLQITSSANTVNMATSSTFQSLFKEVQTYYGYKINVTTKSVTDITTLYMTSATGTVRNYTYVKGADNVNAFYEYLYDNYQMIILGFADTYEDFGVEDVAKSIEKYFDSGRSVLFSHDTTSFINATVDESLPNNVISKSSLFSGGYVDYFYFYTDNGKKISFRYNTTSLAPEAYGGTSAVQSANGKYYITSDGTKYYISISSYDWKIHVTKDGDATEYQVGYKSNFTGRSYVHYWGYSLNKYIRSVVGMDRFGITKVDGLSALSTETDSNNLKVSNNADLIDIIKEQNHDYAFETNSGTVTTTTTSGALESSISDSTKLEAHVQGFTDLTVENNGNQTTESIIQVNRGQITTYPYNLNLSDATRSSVSGRFVNTYSSMRVASTHHQYYQLDLQLDKTGDGQSDIVVWYCLGGNSHSYSPNDVRNNYYIYSVGNVTYTGMGHNGSLSSDEAKLFVNTIIASYKSGIRTPSVTIVESSSNKVALKNLYRTFDGESMDATNENETMAFFVDDYNIIQGQKKIGYWFYYNTGKTLAEYNEMTETERKQYYVYGDYVLKAYTIAELSADGNGPVTVNYISSAEYEGMSEEDKSNYYAYTEGDNTIYLRRMTNGQPMDVTINEDWINSQLENKDSAMLFVGAWTTLDYIDARADGVTSVAFNYVMIKNRDLLDLD